jgi:hypothetical protein
MISNKFIHETNFDFDLKYIRNIVLSKSKDKSHQNNVNQDSYLSELQKCYPFLSPTYNIYVTKPFGIISPHVDAARNVALNIPISGTEGSQTIFYDYIQEPVFYNSDFYVAKFINSKQIKEVYKFELRRPTLIDTTLPHSVKASKYERIILSWSTLPEYKLQDLISKF